MGGRIHRKATSPHYGDSSPFPGSRLPLPSSSRTHTAATTTATATAARGRGGLLITITRHNSNFLAFLGSAFDQTNAPYWRPLVPLQAEVKLVQRQVDAVDAGREGDVRPVPPAALDLEIRLGCVDAQAVLDSQWERGEDRQQPG